MLFCYETLWLRFVGRDAENCLGDAPARYIPDGKILRGCFKLYLKQPRSRRLCLWFNRGYLCPFRDFGDRCDRRYTLVWQ